MSSQSLNIKTEEDQYGTQWVSIQVKKHLPNETPLWTVVKWYDIFLILRSMIASQVYNRAGLRHPERMPIEAIKAILDLNRDWSSIANEFKIRG